MSSPPLAQNSFSPIVTESYNVTYSATPIRFLQRSNFSKAASAQVRTPQFIS